MLVYIPCLFFVVVVVSVHFINTKLVAILLLIEPLNILDYLNKTTRIYKSYRTCIFISLGLYAGELLKYSERKHGIISQSGCSSFTTQQGLRGLQLLLMLASTCSEPFVSMCCVGRV